MIEPKMSYNYVILAPSETAGNLCEQKTVKVAIEEERRECAAANAGQCCLELVARGDIDPSSGKVVIAGFCKRDDCPDPRLPDKALRRLVAGETINAAARNQQACPFFD